MAVPKWVPQNVAEVYEEQRVKASPQGQIFQMTGLWVPVWQAERALAYLQAK